MSQWPNDTIQLLLAIALVLPLLSAVLSLLIRDQYGWIVSFTAPLLMLACAVIASYVSISTWSEPAWHLSRAWFHAGEVFIRAGVLIDNHARMMLLVVSVISSLVHVYSIGYMAGDQGLRKYFSALGFFTFAMLLLCVSDNLLLMFFAWELVGFSSYLLIGHWSEKPLAAAAAKKAFIFNRVADAGFLVGLMIILANTMTFDIIDLSAVDDAGEWYTIAALCIFAGVIGKSAQFPLLTWLPDAMEGPTPVSALIHAATMVVAGVFLLVRVHFLFTPEALNVVAIIGSLTALMAALNACVQFDLKKILAYSTISQLGLMVTAAGVGDTNAAMLHLFTHAFFKACLFLAAGSVIHALEHAQLQSTAQFDVQDIRNLGGLRKKLPFTALAFLIAGSSLAGIPFFSGFLSKDAILSAIHQWSKAGSWQYLIMINAFVVSMLTVMYTFKMIWQVFMGEERKTQALEVHESPAVMRGPIALLMAASVWVIIAWNPIHFDGWLYRGLTPTVGQSGIIVLISAVWVLLALGITYRVRNRIYQSDFLLKTFYLDKLIFALFGANVMRLSEITRRMDVRWIDGIIHVAAYVQVTIASFTGWFDRVIVDGIINMVGGVAKSMGNLIRSFQGGKIQLYVFWSSLAIIIFLIWTLF